MTTQQYNFTHCSPRNCSEPNSSGGIVEPSTMLCITVSNTYQNTIRRNINTHNTSTNAAKYQAAAFSTVRILKYPSIQLRAALHPSRRVRAPDRRASGKDGHLISIRRRSCHALIRRGEVGPLVTMDWPPPNHIPIAARLLPCGRTQAAVRGLVRPIHGGRPARYSFVR